MNPTLNHEKKPATSVAGLVANSNSSIWNQSLVDFYKKNDSNLNNYQSDRPNKDFKRAYIDLNEQESGFTCLRGNTYTFSFNVYHPEQGNCGIILLWEESLT